ncbi:TIGR03086 family metal-binding protein [Streptomyces sp. TRM49041]|uniref:TIGR03086 family metal-binding protein n=1 Tax=Streptomyces sp. TRM49041 TaxID=2603216 RepID=UPI0011EC8858|nr:TIGR03086 family metal-binding protein [Streptomyces sp. TRM49041]
METPVEIVDLTPPARRVAELVRRIEDRQLALPTPCPDYAVRELLAHIGGLALVFRDAARKDLGPTTDTDPGASPPVLEEGWRTTVPRRLGELAEAWREPGAWEGMTRAGGIELPGPVAGVIAFNEVQIHGWDLARATGQAYEPGREELVVSYGLLAPTADGCGSEGLFGPPVPVPDEAPLLDRVVGLSGRQPGWRAAAAG